jgi:small subunit ribosomal protein S17
MSKKVLKGTVVSAKMQDTVVVAVELPKKHSLYGKAMKNTKRFNARVEEEVKEGDEVLIEEARPMSKNVTWKVTQNLSKEEKA